MATPPPPPDTIRKNFLSQLGQYFSPGKAPFAWAVIAVLLLLLFMALRQMTQGAFLDQLTDPARVRGLITVTITFGTIFFALILIVQSFVGEGGTNNEANERFRRAREVFAVLTGILGTIVGFYFGSVEREAREFVVSGARIVNVGGGAVVAQVENGTPPYHYRISFSEKALPVIERDLASPGWIFEPFEARAGVSAVITVTDSGRKEATAEAKLAEGADQAKVTEPTPGVTPSETPTPPAAPAKR
jgi:hypothetical protein